VIDKSHLTWINARKLVAAYKFPSFAEAIKAETGKLDTKRVMGMARKAIRKGEVASKPKSKTEPPSKPMLNQAKDGSFSLQLPSTVSKELASEILSWVEKRLSQ